MSSNNNSDISPASIRVSQSAKIMDKKQQINSTTTTTKEPIIDAATATATEQPTTSVLLPLSSSSQPTLVPPIPSSVKFSSSAVAAVTAVTAGGRSTSRTICPNSRDKTTAGGRRTTSTNRDRSSIGTSVSFATISSTCSHSTPTISSSSSSSKSRTSSATRASRINDLPIPSSPMFNMMSNNNNSKNSSIVHPNHPEIGTGSTVVAGSRLSTSSTDVMMMGDAIMARDDLEAEAEEGGEAEIQDEESNSNHASTTLNQGFARFRRFGTLPNQTTTSAVAAAAAAKKQLDETKTLLDRRLNSKIDSVFFEKNPSQKVPRFAPRGTYVFFV